MKKHSFILKIFLFVLSLFAISCQTDDSPPVYEEGTNEYTNQWIYQQMKRYYYWNSTMPGQGDLSLNPKEYFGSLLRSGDRFSYALHPSMAETFPQSMRRTFGFDISFVEHQGQVYGVILYVLSGSPAANSGLERGEFIKAIDGVVLNQENYEELYQDLVNASQVQLQIVEYTAESGFLTPQQVNIYQSITLSQSISNHIIEQGTNKIGYIEIPHFDVGMAQSILQILQNFKNQSINHLVVDLRYNGGGDISSATALSIILAPEIQPDELFITLKGNQPIIILFG